MGIPFKKKEERTKEEILKHKVILSFFMCLVVFDLFKLIYSNIIMVLLLILGIWLIAGLIVESKYYNE